MADRRWYVHIYGPDDIHAMPDYATAVDMANKQNVLFIELRRRSKWNENDPHMMAVAEPDLSSAERHAEGLKENQLGFIAPSPPAISGGEEVPGRLRSAAANPEIPKGTFDLMYKAASLVERQGREIAELRKSAHKERAESTLEASDSALTAEA